MAEAGDAQKPTVKDLVKKALEAAEIIRERTGEYPKDRDRKIEPLPGTGGLKFIPERFYTSIKNKDTDDFSKAAEERLGEVASTPPAELAKSSEWRRKLQSSVQENKPGQPPLDQPKPTTK